VSAVLLRVDGLTKRFGATQALRDASFDLRAGELHALVGENGSGKSTLVKVLSGVQAPDRGSLELFGRPAPLPAGTKAAQKLGIVTVFQEVLVAEARSVLDNVWLGVDGLLRTRVPAKAKRELATAAFAQLLDRPPSLGTPVEELSLSDRQACCIVRALLREPRILIFDEATASLDVATRDRLFGVLRRASETGVGVVFITHRLDEIDELGDRITVMRAGETVKTLDRGAWTPPELIRLMSGSDRVTGQVRETAESGRARVGAPVLRTRGLRLAPGRAEVDAEIRSGELVGVAGLDGHGQYEFLEALRGGERAGGEVVRLDGDREIPIHSPRHAARHGVAYVPRERRTALFDWMSIRENFGMPTLSRDARFGWLRPGATRRRLSRYIRELGIVAADSDDRITTLSGGNQQKVVIARWLASDPRVLILNDPTRGVDIGTKRQLYALLVRLAEEGLAVVMLSTELDEHVELMDRVLVFREHELYRECHRAHVSRNALASAFFGHEDGDGLA